MGTDTQMMEVKGSRQEGPQGAPGDGFLLLPSRYQP